MNSFGRGPRSGGGPPGTARLREESSSSGLSSASGLGGRWRQEDGSHPAAGSHPRRQVPCVRISDLEPGGGRRGKAEMAEEVRGGRQTPGRAGPPPPNSPPPPPSVPSRPPPPLGGAWHAPHPGGEERPVRRAGEPPSAPPPGVRLRREEALAPSSSLPLLLPLPLPLPRPRPPARRAAPYRPRSSRLTPRLRRGRTGRGRRRRRRSSRSRRSC